jgi:hypothetical protein
MESCPVIKGYYLVIGGGKIDFLIAASTVFICTEAARCHSYLVNAPSHDCLPGFFKINLQIQNLYGLKFSLRAFLRRNYTELKVGYRGLKVL